MNLNKLTMKKILILLSVLFFISCEKDNLYFSDQEIQEETVNGRTSDCTTAYSMFHDDDEVCIINTYQGYNEPLTYYEYLYISSEKSFVFVLLKPDPDAMNCYDLIQDHFAHFIELPWREGDPIAMSPEQIIFNISSSSGFPEGTFTGSLDGTLVSGTFGPH